MCVWYVIGNLVALLLHETENHRPHEVNFNICSPYIFHASSPWYLEISNVCTLLLMFLHLKIFLFCFWVWFWGVWGFFFFFLRQALTISPGWPQTPNPTVFASQVLGLQSFFSSFFKQKVLLGKILGKKTLSKESDESDTSKHSKH
jgi:hypothetical protein